MLLTGYQSLRQQLLKYKNEHVSEKDWEIVFLSAPYVLSLGVGSGVDSFSESLWAHQELFLCLLWCCGPHGCKPCWLSELGELGPTLLEFLVVEVLDVGFKSFTPQGESGRWEGCSLCFSLSYPFFSGCFLVHPMNMNISISFLVSFWRNCSTGSCRLGVPVGGGKVRSSPVSLSWKPDSKNVWT